MTQTITDPLTLENDRREWTTRVETFVNEVEAWAKAQGWATSRSVRNVSERQLGDYSVPVLRVRLPTGEVHVIPVALNVVGADGRIDIEAFPALNRVKLIGQKGQWQIYTDSNVPLRRPWDAQAFYQLAQDLTA
jgi:hypothetical protein